MRRPLPRHRTWSCAKGRAGEVYNIGGGTELTNQELTELLLDACGAGWDRVVHVADRKGHDRRYSLDVTKIREELGYAPRIDLRRRPGRRPSRGTATTRPGGSR